MGFIIGLIAGGLAGAWIGRELGRQKRVRQIEAALREGRVAITDKDGTPVPADDFDHLLSDEFRDA